MPVTLPTGPKKISTRKRCRRIGSFTRFVSCFENPQDSHLVSPELERRIWKRRRYEIRYIETQHDDVCVQRNSRRVAFLSRAVCTGQFRPYSRNRMHQTRPVLPCAKINRSQTEEGLRRNLSQYEAG